MIAIKPKPKAVRIVAIVALLLTLLASVMPVAASPPQPVCFDVVAGLGGSPGTWSSSGLVTSSGTATFDPFVAGWDSKLGIPATVHDTYVLTDEQGSITFKAHGKSALVTDDNDNLVPGYNFNWVILSGTGDYSSLKGQGNGYAWPQFASGTFPIHQCGRAHYHPHR